MVSRKSAGAIFMCLMLLHMIKMGITESTASLPPIVSSKNTHHTRGVLGYLAKFFWPVTYPMYEYLDTFLRETQGVSLPCTIYSLTPFRTQCTPVELQPKPGPLPTVDNQGTSDEETGNRKTSGQKNGRLETTTTVKHRSI